MMRIAAIYDIHGNLPALEAVLRDVRDADVDLVVIGGDVVPGPMPGETLTALLDSDLPLRFIRGNGEDEVLARLAGRETGRVPEAFRDAIRWVGEQLSSEQRQRLARWPDTLTQAIPGLGDTLFCHATPRNNTEIFTVETPAEHLLAVFEKVSERLVVCGHTHMQFDRMVGACRVVNAGSVGMPFGEPGAYWLLLGPDVALCRTPYDLAEASERIRATAYPQADAFAERNVLHPPTVEEVRKLYAGAALAGEDDQPPASDDR